jgi:hypothetical protein
VDNGSFYARRAAPGRSQARRVGGRTLAVGEQAACRSGVVRNDAALRGGGTASGGREQAAAPALQCSRALAIQASNSRACDLFFNCETESMIE